MSASSIRLVHASDLHLERPVAGLSQIPDHLRESLLTAPLTAAERVFDTALSEAADALLLAGDIIDCPLAGPRGMALLREQFERLNERGIPVYWAGGQSDPADSWPASVPLPENVVRFPAGRVTDHQLMRDGEVIARIQGISARKGERLPETGFHRDAHGRLTVGVAYGADEDRSFEGRNVHYMALGGRHARQTISEKPAVIHYSGSPQGRAPTETGTHSCTLVVANGGPDEWSLALQTIETDVLRFVEETLEITASTDHQQLEQLLARRTEKIAEQHSSAHQLITWLVVGAGPLLNRLRPEGPLPKQLIEQLQKRYGQDSPSSWARSLVSNTSVSVPEEWLDQETILGDLLRQFRHLQDHAEEKIDLARFLPRGQREGSLAHLAKVEPRRREALLDRAAKLGLELLEVSGQQQSEP